ncbi:hypothetical protein DYB38_012005 [Aphanomyces astaci]|uniref:Serine/threonine-protein kinase PLK n=1 Tax=Aphanomyces astaci TaxID=112090 RepID=A0A397CKF5_APHAT|nr:hypothetical protein DYB38_012005 [Aphanomyces astaci]
MAELQSTITERCVDEENRESTRTYTRHRFLGKGGFARCYEVTCDTTGAKFAGKIVEKQSLVKPKARLKFTSEIRIHRTLQHPRVVQFKHYFEDDANCYLLLELCTNQVRVHHHHHHPDQQPHHDGLQSLSDLLRRRKRLSEHEVRYYIHQLIQGVAYLHSKCVIHRDLKLGNLFLTTDMQLKIGDFGLASHLDSRDEKRRTMCGTPNYIAPEILNGHHNNGHSFEVDIWSTGVVMYTLLVGKPPFETKDVKHTYKLIRANDYAFPSDVALSATAKSLVMDLLQKDPTRRPSLASILSHPFLQEQSIPAHLPDTAMFITPSSSLPGGRHARHHHRSPLAPLDVHLRPAKPPTAAAAILALPPSASSAITSQKQPLPPMYPVDLLDEIVENLTAAFYYVASADDNAENRVIGQNLLQAKLRVNMDDDDTLSPASLWVLQYVDYTAKYGLGYVLSNQCTGVYFNDATKIIASSTMFGYIDRSPDDQASESPQQVHSLSEYPVDLTKKVTLLGHFKEFIEGEETEESKCLQRNLLLDLPTVPTPMIYVSKWQKTRHCMMFRLSNGTVQTNFFDTTKLLLSHGGKQITYVKDMLQQMVHNAKAA